MVKSNADQVRAMENYKNFLNYLSSKGKIVYLLALLFVLILLPQFLHTYWVYLASEVCINSLFALSLNMLIGYSGMISFGHSAYFGLGAYAVALSVTQFEWGMLESFVVAPFVAALGALLFGLFCIRRSGVYFIMLTLAISQVLYAAIYQWYDVTGGDNGLIGMEPSPIIATPIRYYYFTLFIVVLAAYAIYRIVNSPFGYALKTLRDNPRRAESIGINVPRYRLIVFVMAGFFAGIAGVLYAFFNAAVFPTYLFWLKSAEPLIAIILGGPFHFAGPILGATVLTSLNSLLSRYIKYWMIVLGSVMIGLVLFIREGIIGIFEKR